MAELALSGQPLLDQVATRLGEAGIERPRRVARELWQCVVGTPHSLLEGPSALSDDESAKLLTLVTRLVGGEPLAYVTGWTGFRHLTLRTDRRALIPRPETEGLVELALAKCHHGVAADIGTGSGAIALALASEGAFDRVYGVDASVEALALAKENGDRLQITVHWELGDLLTPIQEPLDLLVSNPPYLTEREYAELDGAVRDFEPRLALPSGDDGLEATRRLLDEGRHVVREGGWIALELDCRRATATAALAEGFGWREVTVQDDPFGRARYLVARRGTTS